MKYHVIGIVAAFAGATIGYYAVGIVARQGFHAIVLAAALPGASRRPHFTAAVRLVVG